MTKKVGNINEEVELVFTPSTKLQSGLVEMGGEEQLLKFSAKLADLTKWFKEFKIDSIDLYIEGVVKTGKLTELFISAEGKGGCKVTLKPKTGK
jgi:hypothetical protein